MIALLIGIVVIAIIVMAFRNSKSVEALAEDLWLPREE